ncbi:MAG: 3-isopropylmalate dehydratase small subunit [Chloroflexi bacterium 44-23]|nr:MAG: 3-isopropylmalate dehydratase small subunit [Chloroflexi bacterium 44-23]
MMAFGELTTYAYRLLEDDIDTDQIIPARFLKVTDSNGLGAALFADWRYLPDGRINPEFVLNQPMEHPANILVAGNNFGCGSSREHAPWALVGFGFRAVISTGFADIFRNNALKNGLLPIQLTEKTYRQLLAYLDETEDAWMKIDLANQQLVLADGQQLDFPIDPFSKTCLLEGVDEMGYLLQLGPWIDAFEKGHTALGLEPGL